MATRRTKPRRLIRPSSKGRSEDRPRRDERRLHSLRDWLRHELPADETSLAREIVERSATILESPRVLLAWEEADEPWLHLDYHHDGQHQRWQEVSESFGRLVPHVLRSTTFYCPDARTDAPVVLASGAEKKTRQPLHQGLAQRFDIRSFLAVPLDGDSVRGRLFCLDLPQPDVSIFSIAGLVSSIAVSRFDLLARMQRLRTEAVSEGLVRVARDLHDGLLQSFTGIVLQLETVHQLLERDPQTARQMVTRIEGMLMSDQRELRAYLERLRPWRRPDEGAFDLDGRLNELRERYRHEWQVEIHFSMGSMPPIVSHSLGWETYRIIAEAVTNSAKHGHASNIGVELSSENDQLRIIIDDDGSGFPFRGRFALNELSESQRGPAVLGERVASLNGSAIVDSTDTGARLEISIPLGWSE